MRQRTRNKAAISALMAACAGMSIRRAEASLTFDIIATSVSGSGTLVDSKHVVGVANGDVIAYEVHALIPGANTSTTGFANGYAVLATTGTGTIQADLTHVLNPGFVGFSQAGTPHNLGGDTDTDIGPSLSPSNGQGGDIFYRSNDVTGHSQSFDTVLGTGTATITDASLADSIISFIRPATTNIDKTPTWFEDGAVKNSTTGTIIVNAGITVSSIPEPGSLALLVTSGVALICRHRRRMAQSA